MWILRLNLIDFVFFFKTIFFYLGFNLGFNYFLKIFRVKSILDFCWLCKVIERIFIFNWRIYLLLLFSILFNYSCFYILTSNFINLNLFLLILFLNLTLNSFLIFICVCIIFCLNNFIYDFRFFKIIKRIFIYVLWPFFILINRIFNLWILRSLKILIICFYLLFGLVWCGKIIKRVWIIQIFWLRFL